MKMLAFVFFSSDPLGDSFTEVPEAEKVPSLVFCGEPARWIKGIAACRVIVRFQLFSQAKPI